jgi:hypothetical protein
VPDEALSRYRSPSAKRLWEGSIFKAGHADGHPVAAEMAVEHTLRPGYRHRDAFAFEPDIILESIEWMSGVI